MAGFLARPGRAYLERALSVGYLRLTRPGLRERRFVAPPPVIAEASRSDLCLTPFGAFPTMSAPAASETDLDTAVAAARPS